jgi:hypothetical protein
MNASELRALVRDITGSAMGSSSSVRWNPTVPLTLVRTAPNTFNISYGVTEFLDPVESPQDLIPSYDVQLLVGTDGKLHAAKSHASISDITPFSDTVVAQLDTALSRMTTVPAPHLPMHFSLSASTNITWGYGPVAVG